MPSTLVTGAELAAHLDDPSWVVVDVRHDLSQPGTWGEGEYRKAHLPGARFVHLDRDLSAPMTGANGRHPLPSPEAAAALFGRLGIGPDTQVVAYDQNVGHYAARLWWMLRWLGHDAAAVLDGGFDRWLRDGRPTTKEVPEPRAAAFTIRRVLPIADTREIHESLAAHALFVIDARGPERYRGETEPLDPVAGHIPGAHNRPFGRNMNAEGTFKGAAELRNEFGELLGPTLPERVVHQCGSGVTACHNLLAMAVAGYPLTRLYPGSWSEWCADRSRPVATGSR